MIELKIKDFLLFIENKPKLINKMQLKRKNENKTFKTLHLKKVAIDLKMMTN